VPASAAARSGGLTALRPPGTSPCHCGSAARPGESSGLVAPWAEKARGKGIRGYMPSGWMLRGRVAARWRLLGQDIASASLRRRVRSLGTRALNTRGTCRHGEQRPRPCAGPTHYVGERREEPQDPRPDSPRACRHAQRAIRRTLSAAPIGWGGRWGTRGRGRCGRRGGGPRRGGSWAGRGGGPPRRRDRGRPCRRARR